MAANSLHRTARPRQANTVDANIVDLWQENSRLRTLLEQRQVLPPPLEMVVTVGPGQQRTVQIVNTETGGILTAWGPA